MDTKLALLLVSLLFILKYRSAKRANFIKRQRARRLRVFRKRQAQERKLFLSVVAMSSNLYFFQERSVWEKQKSGHWWERVVPQFSPSDWVANFRVSSSTFSYLCDNLCEHIQRVDTMMRVAITVEKRVAIALWFLATGADFRTIAHSFGVLKFTVCLAVKEVCYSVVQVLLPQHIKVPTGQHLRDVIEGFKRDFKFPQCAGAVDGTHVPIQSPPECPADYYNRKG